MPVGSKRELGVTRYGSVNMHTREWKDGILSKTMRDLGQIPDTHPKWIMLDGDLDANWIESMTLAMQRVVLSE